jgi:predicted ATP-grasp superfamily ATP-dependent carboligase
VEAASLPLILSQPHLLGSAKARRAARRVARLMADADRFERAAMRLEDEIGPDGWQVQHLRHSAGDLRRLAGEEAARLAPAVAAA